MILLSMLLNIIILYISNMYIKSLDREKKLPIKKCIFMYILITGIVVYSFYSMTDVMLCMVILCIVSILIIMDIVDGVTMVIPDSLLIILLLLTLIFSILNTRIYMFDRIIGMTMISIPLLLMNIWYKEVIGGGDIKLLMIVGYLLGYQQMLVVIIIATITGGMYAYWLLYVLRLKNIKCIAFGPFLCKSILITMYFGKEIIQWYLCW